MVWVPEWTRFRPPRDNRHHQNFQDPNPADHSPCPTMFCGYGSGLVRLTTLFELPSDTPAHGCLDAHDHGWHGAPALRCLRVFVPSASVWSSLFRASAILSASSPLVGKRKCRCFASSWVNLACRLMIKPFNFDGSSSLNSRSLLLIRDV